MAINPHHYDFKASDLTACPFCGSGQLYQKNLHIGQATIECGSCHAHGPIVKFHHSEDWQIVIDAWEKKKKINSTDSANE